MNLLSQTDSHGSDLQNGFNSNLIKGISLPSMQTQFQGTPGITHTPQPHTQQFGPSQAQFSQMGQFTEAHSQLSSQTEFQNLLTSELSQVL
jgi:hypothetical protein